MKLLIALLAGASLVAQQPGRDLVLEASEKFNRFALVIGNESYAHAPLKNPVNDAKTVAETLVDLGFKVDLVLNADLKSMSKAVDRFVTSIRPGDVAFFYYAGHGVQIEGENLLVPVDFDAKDEADARYETYSASRVHERMEGAGARINIIVLDACRNNPFRAARSGAGGLLAMNTGRGTFIAFATSPGKTASDNPNGNNGLFTTHLVSTLRQPGLTLDQVFNRVREGVYQASSQQQLPWTGSSVIGEFYFRAPAAGGAAPQPSPQPVTQVEPPRPASVRAPDPAPSTASASTAELDEQFSKLSARALAVRASLEQLQQSQARMGLSLRGDITASWKLMESYMDQTEAALKRGDSRAGSRSFDLAEREVTKLEKFLGR
jgi:uncharacterized caspase-like protein